MIHEELMILRSHVSIAVACPKQVLDGISLLHTEVLTLHFQQSAMVCKVDCSPTTTFRTSSRSSQLAMRFLTMFDQATGRCDCSKKYRICCLATFAVVESGNMLHVSMYSLVRSKGSDIRFLNKLQSDTESVKSARTSRDDLTKGCASVPRPP